MACVKGRAMVGVFVRNIEPCCCKSDFVPRLFETVEDAYHQYDLLPANSEVELLPWRQFIRVVPALAQRH